MEIKYFNREAERLEIEKVYGEEAVKWFYQSSMGKMIQPLATSNWVSTLYGATQSSFWSRSKINPFIEKFNIQMDDYLPQEGRTEVDPYESFNHFFIRRFKPGKRSFVAEENKMAAPSEARYFGYEEINDQTTIPVKGVFLKPESMVEHETWGKTFEGGPLMIARLCPVDYHRFHFPDDGKILDTYRRGNVLHSVNPMALKEKEDIFLINERAISILDTKNFGKLAYIEVGAICVGRIVHSHKSDTFKRGDEKGYFLFGGSTVVIIGEKGRWKPSQDMLDHTKNGIECYIKLGDEVALKL